MEILGYSAAILIGVSLGLIGGGGSILTVPVLVYLFGVPAATATGYSLFVVGSTALVGAVGYMRQGFVNFRCAAFFGFPATISVIVTRKIIVPAIPASLFHLGNMEFTKDKALLLVFALLMVSVAYTMIHCKPIVQQPGMENTQQPQKPLGQIVLTGFAVGFVSGLVGVGGGFLIIPTLVSFVGQTMKQAIGTSLLVISATSLIGFFSTALPKQMEDWHLLLWLAGIAIGGILIGVQLAKHIAGEKLKPAFGYFVLIMGVFIVGKELIGK